MALSLNTKIDLPLGGSAFESGIQADNPKGLAQELAKPFQRLAAWVSGRKAGTTEVRTEKAKDGGKAEFRLVRQGRAGHVKLAALGQKLEPSRKATVPPTGPASGSSGSPTTTTVKGASSAVTRTTSDALKDRTGKLDAAMAEVERLTAEVSKTKSDLRAELVLSRSASKVQAKIAELGAKLGPLPAADTPRNRKLQDQIREQEGLLKKVLADPPQTERGRNLHTKLKLEQAKLDAAITKGLEEHRAASKLAVADGGDKTVTDKLAGQWRQLSLALMAQHLPAVGTLTGSIKDDGAAWRQTQVQTTGLSELQLRDQFDAGRLADDSPSYQLISDPAKFLATMERDLAALDKKGLLKPELLRRMSELGPMAEWSKPVDSTGGGISQQKQARDNLSALAVFADMLHAVARGNHDVIDTLMSGDRGLDEYAGKLKRLAAEQDDVPKPARQLVEDRAKVQHELSRVKRDLGQLLLLDKAGWNDKRVINAGGENQLKIDSRLVARLRELAQERGNKELGIEAGKRLVRDVNLLIAHAMLLEKKLTQLDEGIDPSKRIDLTADHTRAKDDISAHLAKLVSGDRAANLALPNSGDALLANGAKVSALKAIGRLDAAIREQTGLTELGRDIRAGQRVDQARLAGGVDDRGAPLSEDVKRELEARVASADNALGEIDKRQAVLQQRIVEADQACRPLFADGHLPTADDVAALAALAHAVRQHAEIGAALERATQDGFLGLDDTDLKAMGFKSDEITALKQDLNQKYPEVVGGLASIGLKRSEDIDKVTSEINLIRRHVIQGGLSQDAMKEFSKEVPEARARRLLDLVYQDATGQVRKFGMKPEDLHQAPTDGSKPATHVDAFKTKIDAFKADPAFNSLTFNTAGAEADRLSVRLGVLSTTLSRLDSGMTSAQERLGELAQQNGLKIDPKKPQGLQMSMALLDAVRTDQILSAFEAEHPDLSTLSPDKQATHRELTEQLNQGLEKLKHFDRSNFQSSRLFGDGIRSREELRAFATPNNIEVAQLIKGIRDTPEQIKLVKAEIVAASTERDDLLAERRTAMQAGGQRSDIQLRNAIRATVVESRLAAGGDADFDPVAKRPEIEAQLRSWGIDTDAFRPEIEDVLFASFDSAELERWIDDAAENLANKAHRDIQRPSLLARAGQALWTHFSGQRVVDGGTQHVMLDTIKSLKPGQSISLEQGDGVFLSSGAVPVDPTGTLRARAEVAAGERKLLQVARTEEGYELFFKTGSKGQGTLGASLALFNVADASVAVTGGGSRISGAGLLFKKEADLSQFLLKLTSGQTVRPGDWAKAHEAVLVTDRTVHGGVEAGISASTQSIGNKVPWVKEHLVFDKTFFGHLDAEIYAGLEASAGAKREERWVEASNLGKTVKEHEVTVEGEIGLKIGAYVSLPSAGDAALDHAMEEHGLTKQIDEAVGKIPDWTDMQRQQGTNNATLSSKDEHLYNPFGSTTSGPLGVGVTATHQHGKVTRLAFMADTNQLASEGNEIVKTYTATGKLGVSDLYRVKPTFTSAEERAGAQDSLREALKDKAFRDDVQKLLSSASPSDKLAVTYVLKDEVRTVVNDLMRDAARHRERAAAHERAGQSLLAQHENKIAGEMEDRARELYGRQSSFVADKVELVKTTQSQNDINVLGIGQAKWTRYSDGNFERPAITLNIPGGPSAREATEKAEKTSDKAVLSSAPQKPHTPPPTTGTVPDPSLSPPTPTTTPSVSVDQGPPETLLSTKDVRGLIDQRLGSPGATPEAVRRDQAFFVEPQRALRCGLHALNGMLGGPVVQAQELDAFIALRLSDQATDDSAARALNNQRSITDGGIDLDVAKMFLGYLAEQAKLPFRFEASEVWARGAGIDPIAKLPDIVGDAMEVEILSDGKNGAPGYNHFVAFRQDADGGWRLLDSLNSGATADGQRIVGTPHDWVRDKLQNYDVRKVGILQKVPHSPQPEQAPIDPSRYRSNSSAGLGLVSPEGPRRRDRALSEGDVRPVTFVQAEKEPTSTLGPEEHVPSNVKVGSDDTGPLPLLKVSDIAEHQGGKTDLLV